MAIYEFYCKPCHTVFNFYARSMAAAGRTPQCPKCGHTPLDKQVSRFAISKGLSEPAAGGMDDPFANMDESKMDSIMAEMAETFGDEEGESGEEDPRKMAAVMKKFFDATGMPPNATMSEAIARMEAGEDPDKIDEELGDALDADDPFAAQTAAGRLRQRIRDLFNKPKIDPGLYDL